MRSTKRTRLNARHATSRASLSNVLSNATLALEIRPDAMKFSFRSISRAHFSF
jgi:hypothetical protein